MPRARRFERSLPDPERCPVSKSRPWSRRVRLFAVLPHRCGIPVLDLDPGGEDMGPRGPLLGCSGVGTLAVIGLLLLTGASLVPSLGHGAYLPNPVLSTLRQSRFGPACPHQRPRAQRPHTGAPPPRSNHWLLYRLLYRLLSNARRSRPGRVIVPWAVSGPCEAAPGHSTATDSDRRATAAGSEPPGQSPPPPDQAGFRPGTSGSSRQGFRESDPARSWTWRRCRGLERSSTGGSPLCWGRATRCTAQPRSSSTSTTLHDRPDQGEETRPLSVRGYRTSTKSPAALAAGVVVVPAKL